MSEENDQAKATILCEATDAVMKGVGPELETTELRKSVSGYWDKRIRANETDILTHWGERKKRALDKATEIGARAATLASEKGEPTVTMDHFLAGLDDVNKGDNWSNWC